MEKEKRTFTAPTNEEIAAYAYQLWEAEGRPEGRALDHWIQAQAHLMADRQYEAGLATAQQQSGPKEPQRPGKPGKTDKRKRAELPQGAGLKHQSAYL